MAKKRRGRPLGSKNKKKVGRPTGVKGLTKNFAKMQVSQLRDYIARLEEALAAKIQQQREFLEGQLAGLQIYANNKAGAAVMRVPHTRKRAKPAPKYQSKKDKKLKWTGRGRLPNWMRAEMKGTKLPKDDFLIR